MTFAEWVDFDYWWSFSSGGSAINGATPTGFSCTSTPSWEIRLTPQYPLLLAALKQSGHCLVADLTFSSSINVHLVVFILAFLCKVFILIFKTPYDSIFFLLFQCPFFLDIFLLLNFLAALSSSRNLVVSRSVRPSVRRRPLWKSDL